MISISILSDNNSKNSRFSSEHGLSVMIEKNDFKVLFDTGQGVTMLENASVLGRDIIEVDALVLSHGHYDHAGGVESFMEFNSHAGIFIHPDALCDRYNVIDGNVDSRNIGIGILTREKMIKSGRLKSIRDPVILGGGIIVSGEVPRNSEYEIGASLFVKEDKNGYLCEDRVIDEQFLVMNGSDGAYLFLGCAHPGIENCISYANSISSKRVAGIIGGLHMGKLSPQEIEKKIEYLKSLDLKMLAPLHCTGEIASSILRREFEGIYATLGAGDMFSIEE